MKSVVSSSFPQESIKKKKKELKQEYYWAILLYVDVTNKLHNSKSYSIHM